jgi:hypothetical protein
MFGVLMRSMQVDCRSADLEHRASCFTLGVDGLFRCGIALAASELYLPNKPNGRTP